jgi:hypothetical protein
MTDITERPKRRWRPLQFSLRIFLLVFTAVGIGFPIWYRWPYEEVDERRSPSGKTVLMRRITTWQRQWGGGRMMEGPETLTTGDLMQRTMFVHDRAHGPFQVTFKGKQRVGGQYVDDKKEGTWIHQQDGFTQIANWRRGKLDGEYTSETPNGKSRWVFSAGRLLGADGHPVKSRLMDLCEADQLDSRTATELSKQTTMEFVETPLKDALIYLQEQHGLPIALDDRRVANVDEPVTLALDGIDLGSALILLTSPRGLECDYRYGMVWVTTAEDAKDWHDPTGVAEIRPAKDSSIGRVWNEPSRLEAIHEPLASALARCVQRLAIEVDMTQVAPTTENPIAFSLTLNLNGLPFRHILGVALYETGCRCKLEGDTVVILPPDGANAPPIKTP